VGLVEMLKVLVPGLAARAVAQLGDGGPRVWPPTPLFPRLAKRRLGDHDRVSLMRKRDVDFAALEDLLAQVFGAAQELTCERTAAGVSTQVYRVRRLKKTFYLRVAEEQTASLAPEAELHRVLRAAGVKVPEIIHFEALDPGLGRSVMVTSEISGSCVGAGTPLEVVRDVFVEAGRDLATINQIQVEGFGWIMRDGRAWPLRGEYQSYSDFVATGLASTIDLEGALRRLADGVFSKSQRKAIEQLAIEEVEGASVADVSFLAHGDFDITHVFENRGRYTGIIDFGEIRGTERGYDLAHFRMQLQPPWTLQALPWLEAGYAQVEPMPFDYRVRGRRIGVLIAVHRLARWLEVAGPDIREHPTFRFRSKQIVKDLTSHV
jgi:aminoglycoside phosphotransferase (APT) family kinase protein